MSQQKFERRIEPGLYITLFADASFCFETKAWGYGVWIKYGIQPSTLITSGGGVGIKDSFRAEVEALKAGIIEALRLPTQDKILVIQSDCTGALAIIKDEMRTQLCQSGLRNFYTKHVKGHRGFSNSRSSVNTICDRLAKKEMYERRASETIRRAHKTR